LQIDAAILNYVARHPEAKDTVEGIAEWWFEPPVRPSVAEVKATLDQMVRRGWMVAEEQADGRINYHRAKAVNKGQ
jgi:hypothetical protein